MTDKLKVVIVDDEPIIVKGLCNLFDWESNGFEVVGSANNGYKAIELFRQQKPDIILTDIRMPKLSGLELIKELKNEENELEFIIISGYDEFAYCQEALSLGVFDYILKPINYSILKEKLQLLKDKIKKKRAEEITKKNLIRIAQEADHIKKLDCLKRLIFKNNTAAEDADEISAELNKLYSEFIVAIVKINLEDRIRIDLFKSLLQKHYNAIYENVEIGCFVFTDNDCIVVVIGFQERNIYSENAYNILTEFTSKFTRSFYIGTGNTCVLNGIAGSYLKAIDMLRASESKENGETIYVIKKYIDEHYYEDISLSMLSKICSMNKYYLSKFFKDKMKINFSHYLQDIRIDKARKLLIGSELSVGEVSEKVGFSDYRIFIRVFRKKMGITPKQFRMKLNGEVEKKYV